MTTVESAIDLILVSFSAAWADRTPVAWPNLHFDPDAVADKPAGYVRVAINHDLGELAGLATTVERREGTVFVSIFTSEGSGLAQSNALAQVAARWLATWPINAVHMRRPSITTLGPDGNGWYQVNVTAEFEYRTT